jgi:hypothetical protein
MDIVNETPPHRGGPLEGIVVADFSRVLAGPSPDVGDETGAGYRPLLRTVNQPTTPR